MSGDQVYGLVGLTVIGLAFVAVIVAAIADERAQKAHDEWHDRFSKWLIGGMKGPRP